MASRAETPGRSESRDYGFEERFRARQAEAMRLSAQLDTPSLMARLARLSPEVRERIYSQLSVIDQARLAYHWPVWARGKQNPDLSRIPHRALFLCSGRGFGKTFSAAQRYRQRHELGARVGAIIGPTHRKMEQYMIEGTEAAPGLLRIYPPDLRPIYLPHKGRIDFKLPPGIGGPAPIAFTHSAEDRDFRGTNLDTVWGDEIAEWPYLEELSMNIEMSTRARTVGIPVELIFSSTPIRRRFIRELVEDEDTITIIGTTTENAANVDPKWLAKMEKRWGGTRRGREELEGEILSDNPEALFSATKLDFDRVKPDEVPEGLRICIAVDPGITQETGVDPTGIVVMGEDEETHHIYILADLTRPEGEETDRRLGPEEWGRIVVDAYDRYRAVAVVAETNRGGDLVLSNIRAAMREKRGSTAAQAIPVERVHASRGKYIRAEPVSALHEKGMIHVVGAMRELEAELTEWSPTERGPSPNRLDAVVWGAYWLGRLGDVEDPVDYKAGFRGYAEYVSSVSAAAAPRPADVPSPMRPAPQFPAPSRWGSRRTR